MNLLQAFAQTLPSTARSPTIPLHKTVKPKSQPCLAQHILALRPLSGFLFPIVLVSAWHAICPDFLIIGPLPESTWGNEEFPLLGS